MRQSRAATGGWSRFETKTTPCRAVTGNLVENMPALRKRRAGPCAQVRTPNP